MNIADKILQNQDRDGMLRRSLERIIQLYTDKSHFVYELLQNAEDAGATGIRFVQYSDRLVRAALVGDDEVCVRRVKSPFPALDRGVEAL